MKYFVYFSLSGNGDYLASLLKEKGYEPVKIEMVKPPKKVGFFSIMKYGFRAGANKKEKIKEHGFNPYIDDTVIVGSPIWNDRLATPINTLLEQVHLNKDTTRFIVYPAGEKAVKVVKQLEKHGFRNKPVVIQNPLVYKETAHEALKEF